MISEEKPLQNDENTQNLDSYENQNDSYEPEYDEIIEPTTIQYFDGFTLKTLT
jgi:hypothetical protein